MYKLIYFLFELLPRNVDAGLVVEKSADVVEKGKVVSLDNAHRLESLSRFNGSACDSDGLEGNALECFHSILEAHACAKKSTDLTGSAAEYGNVKVAGSKLDVVGMSAAEVEKDSHLADSLTEESCLGVVMLELTALALVGHTDCERNAESVSVLESNSALNTANVGGKAYVVVGSLEEIADLAEKLDLASAEGYARGIEVSKLVAGAGTADCAEVDVLLTASSSNLFHSFGIGDHLTFAEVDHTLGDRENRNSVGETRNYVIEIPIKTEARYAANGKISSLESFFELVNCVVLGACGNGTL